MDLKHVVPDMEKTFGRLTFGGEGEAEVTRGRNSRPLSRTYNLFSDVQRADDISVKITGNVGQHAFEFMEEVELVKENFEPKEFQPIGTTVPALAGEYFLVTGSGKYFRNVSIKPEDSICMIELDDKGENYRIVWGLVNGGRPTSELPSHLMNLEVKKLQDPDYRVVYHAHTTNIIALTFVLPLEDKVFTRELWEMATECPVVFPDGVGVVPWMVPGGREIAVATSELMKKYDLAIWAHHGTFAAGKDFDLTFGLMHTVEKSAEILVKMLSMQQGKRQTITPDDFRHLAKDFGVTLPEEFLYEK